MRFILIAILLSFNTCLLISGQVETPSYGVITYDDELSLKNLAGIDFRDNPKYDLNNKVIYRTSFMREEPNMEIFPEDVQNLTLYYCILDNIVIPAGITLIECQNNTFKSQNDGEDWIVDSKSLEPIEPVNKEKFEKLGVSIDPANIPKKKQEKSVLESKAEEVAITKQIEELQAELATKQAQVDNVEPVVDEPINP